MPVELVFETKLIYQVLRQDGAVELEPAISLQLDLTQSPEIYASDHARINNAAWGMTIRRCDPGAATSARQAGRMHYMAGGGKLRCMIEVQQSAERYAILLDMFKGGRPSEITLVVDDLTDLADYSKEWNTSAGNSLPIASICFEFPLPQSEA